MNDLILTVEGITTENRDTVLDCLKYGGYGQSDLAWTEKSTRVRLILGDDNDRRNWGISDEQVKEMFANLHLHTSCKVSTQRFGE